MNYFFKYIKYKLRQNDNWWVLSILMWFISIIVLLFIGGLTASLFYTIVGTLVFGVPISTVVLFVAFRGVKNIIQHQIWAYRNWKSQFTSYNQKGETNKTS